MRKLLRLGAFLILGVAGAAAAPSAAEACKHARRVAPPPAEMPRPTAETRMTPPKGAPIIVSAAAAGAEPSAVAWARDYGRTLLLLAAPAAFVGLALRLHRRGEL